MFKRQLTSALLVAMLGGFVATASAAGSVSDSTGYAETLLHKWWTQQLAMTDGSTTSLLPSFSRDDAESDNAQGVEGRRGDTRAANADDAGRGSFFQARQLHRESGGGGGK